VLYKGVQIDILIPRDMDSNRLQWAWWVC